MTTRYKDKEQLINMAAIRLLENIGKLSCGTAAVFLTVHQGKIVGVCHEIKETIRKREEVHYEGVSQI